MTEPNPPVKNKQRVRDDGPKQPKNADFDGRFWTDKATGRKIGVSAQEDSAVLPPTKSNVNLVKMQQMSRKNSKPVPDKSAKGRHRDTTFDYSKPTGAFRKTAKRRLVGD